MNIEIDLGVRARFPTLAIAWAELDGLTIAGPGDERAAALQRDAQASVRARRSVDALKDDPLFRAYRDFYWALGIDPTKTRPSGEALNRRVLHGNALPSINAFVDAYNALSLEMGVAIGAYDLDRITGAILLRDARPGESFVALAATEPRPLSGGELVLADAEKIINFYPYRDAAATRVTTNTRRALIVACGAPGIEDALLVEAAKRAAAFVARACGGTLVGVGPRVPDDPR